MDYEKKYKNALAIAKDCLKDGTITSTAIDYIETIFPELKNKDEEIRKALIRFHKSTIDVDGINGDDILAWLEKQRNNTPTITWHSIDEKPEEMKELFCEWESDDSTWHDVAFYDRESHTFRRAKRPINVTKWVYVDELLEKQVKQKPTSNTRYKVSAGGSLNVNGKPFDYEHATITQKDFAPINVTDEGIVEAIKNTSVLDMIEQKQEWSEEDEEMAEDLIKGCVSAEKAHHFLHTPKEVSDWLKSLKDRVRGKED